MSSPTGAGPEGQLTVDPKNLPLVSMGHTAKSYSSATKQRDQVQRIYGDWRVGPYLLLTVPPYLSALSVRYFNKGAI